eukprot:459870_1
MLSLTAMFTTMLYRLLLLFGILLFGSMVTIAVAKEVMKSVMKSDLPSSLDRNQMLSQRSIYIMSQSWIKHYTIELYTNKPIILQNEKRIKKATSKEILNMCGTDEIIQILNM